MVSRQSFGPDDSFAVYPAYFLELLEAFLHGEYAALTVARPYPVCGSQLVALFVEPLLQVQEAVEQVMIHSPSYIGGSNGKTAVMCIR